MALPRQGSLDTNEFIASGKPDLISLRVVTEGRDVFFEHIYVLKLKIVYNQDDRSLETKPLLLVLSRQSNTRGSTVTITDGESRNAAEQNARALSNFLKVDAVRDPEFDKLCASYEEMELL